MKNYNLPKSPFYDDIQQTRTRVEEANEVAFFFTTTTQPEQQQQQLYEAAVHTNTISKMVANNCPITRQLFNTISFTDIFFLLWRGIL